LKQHLHHIILSACLILVSVALPAQKENALIRSGNRLYKQKQVDQSQQQYQKAIEQAPANPTAHYNLGNAQFRKDDFENAVKSYDASIGHAADKDMQEKGLYNKGVAEIKQQKLEESIRSWKDALKIDPADSDARENLQKALLELKSKQPQKQKEDQKQNQQKQDQQKKEQQNQQQQQPKPQQSRLSKQQVQQLLQALEQKEKDVQDKMNQNKPKAPSQPDKDW
jgi:tetratricopeptide (TPR) repeat protein